MTRRPQRSTLSSSSAASDVYKRQVSTSSWSGMLESNGSASSFPNTDPSGLFTSWWSASASVSVVHAVWSFNLCLSSLTLPLSLAIFSSFFQSLTSRSRGGCPPLTKVNASLNKPPTSDCGSPKSPGTTRDVMTCLLYTSPSPRDRTRSRMPSSA
eukprot:TRINITY_DN13399_c0_g1_i2.p1 TRINITY_DN13399_c0_g1~~TRINITY_DN13399_c0_g1_i2.p1  ORF type:complete len:155 (+),score=7.00 TRINITY_DN13399_c0_g1_i2:84-548(+)